MVMVTLLNDTELELLEQRGLLSAYEAQLEAEFPGSEECSNTRCIDCPLYLSCKNQFDLLRVDEDSYASTERHNVSIDEDWSNVHIPF